MKSETTLRLIVSLLTQNRFESAATAARLRARYDADRSVASFGKTCRTKGHD